MLGIKKNVLKLENWIVTSKKLLEQNQNQTIPDWTKPKQKI